MKSSRIISLVFGISLLASIQSPGILDMNGNGLSDPWEGQFNNQHFFPNSAGYLPNDDPDGDGWNNAQEAAAGTNPFEANPPDGIIRPEMEHIQATYLTTPENGTELLTPETYTLTWPTITGKCYDLQSSLDLATGSWLSIGPSLIAEGGTTSTTIPVTQPDGSAPDKLFWRVTITDVDTDGDGLTNAEEAAYATNPNSADSDDDGVSDLDEIARGSEPKNKDSDGDDTLDGEDADPLDGAITWKKTPESSYAVIELGKPPLIQSLYSWLPDRSVAVLGENGHVLMSIDREQDWWEENGLEQSGAAGPEYYETCIWNPATTAWSEPLELPANLRGCGTSIDAQGNVYGFGFGAISTSDPYLPGSKAVSLYWGKTTSGWNPASPEITTGFAAAFGNTYSTMMQTAGMINHSPVLFGSSGRFVSQPAGGNESYQEANLYRLGTADSEPLCTGFSSGDGSSVVISNLKLAGEPAGWHAATWDESTTTVIPPLSQGTTHSVFAQLTANGQLAPNTPPDGNARWSLNSLASINGAYMPTGVHDIVIWSTTDGSIQAGARSEADSNLAWKASTKVDATQRIGGKINARGEGLTVTHLWRNGRWIPLADFVDNTLWTNIKGIDINSNGLILATADKVKIGATDADKNIPLLLIPVMLGVDANRDDEITFDGKDKTTVEKPFRFWINNDEDNVEQDEPVEVGLPDSAGSYISTRRDLEDFCRLRILIGIDNALLRSGTFQVGVKFVEGNPEVPQIRCWENQSPGGDASYLTEPLAADRQKALLAFPRNSDTGISMIPAAFWARRCDSNAEIIFEGVEKGLGKLVVTIHDKNGVLLGEGGETWIKLLDVQNMYQRAKVKKSAEEIPEPWVNDNPDPLQWEWTTNGHQYIEDPQAEPLACIFVHGWNMTYAESLSWANTSFKRLWQQGFKGKFYAFRWATFSEENSWFIGGRTTYNPSEYRAWRCGPALADFVNQLPESSREKRLFAHSMGNVISGAALRAGMKIEQYSLCNAAMSASAYDTNPALRKDQAGNDLTLIGDRNTPDTDPDPAYRAAFGLQDKFNNASFPRMFNFGLPNDFALGVWTSNNFLWKPEEALGYYYSTPPYNRPTCFNRIVTSLPEAMGYVTKSLTRTAGADLRTNGGIITDFHDMSTWAGEGAEHGGFGSEHSAEWKWNYQSTNLFWKQLAEALQLKKIIK